MKVSIAEEKCFSTGETTDREAERRVKWENMSECVIQIYVRERDAISLFDTRPR